MDNNLSWMTDEEYKLVTQKTPIPTVDMVVLRKNKNILETLLLIRKTGYEKGKWCIIGGRIFKGETLQEAINRHVSDLEVQVSIIPPFSPDFPTWVDSNPDQDKTKHSITHVYPVTIIRGNVREEGEEYSGFKWFPADQLPKMAYGHKQEVLTTIERMNNFGVKL